MPVYYGKKAYFEYKKYSYTSWAQPVLSANGTVGGSSYAARASSTYSGHDPWKAFNGTNNNEDDCWEAATRDTSQWLEFYSPDTLEISKIKFTNRRNNYITVFNPILITGSMDGSSYFTIGQITPPDANSDSQYTFYVPSAMDKHCKYIRFQTTSDGTLIGNTSARPNFGRIEFTAQKVTGTTAGTSSNYDYTISKSGSSGSMDFVSPKMKSNGIMGGDSFAVDQQMYATDSSGTTLEAWRCFDKDTSANKWEITNLDKSKYYWLDIYSPFYLQLSNIKILFNDLSYYANRVLISGSDNRIVWTRIKESDLQAVVEQSIALPAHLPYKYYRLEFRPSSATSMMIREIYLTGKYLSKMGEVYKGSTAINQIYVGSSLRYAASVPDTDFLKQPDFSTAESIQDGIASSFTLDDGYLCLYNNRTSQAIKTCDICPDFNFSSSNTIRIMYMEHLSGISNPCGGSIFHVPRGWWWKTTNMATGFSCYAKTAPGGRIPYKNRFKLTRLPDYTTGFSIDQNEIIYATKDQWLNSYGSNRKIEIATKSDMSDAVTIADGVSSATQEPSTMVFIEEGLYFRTSGTNNTRFLCKGV